MYNALSLSLVTVFFFFNVYFLGISIATPAFSQFQSAWNILFHYFSHFAYVCRSEVSLFVGSEYIDVLYPLSHFIFFEWIIWSLYIWGNYWYLSFYCYFDNCLGVVFLAIFCSLFYYLVIWWIFWVMFRFLFFSFLCGYLF